MKQIAAWIFTLLVIAYMLSQCRKPTGWLSRLVLLMWNSSHSHLTDWGLTHVSIEKHFAILDVGCGGGRTISKLANLAPEGKVCGIDYSKNCVAASSKKNHQVIEKGRVEIKHGSVSQLPFPDGVFDLVTAVETHYYWPSLVSDMQEIRRVLKPGGRLILVVEAYKQRKYDPLNGAAMRLLRATYLTVREHSQLLTEAGYSEIEMFEETKKGWLCGVAKKAEFV